MYGYIMSQIHYLKALEPKKKEYAQTSLTIVC